MFVPEFSEAFSCIQIIWKKRGRHLFEVGNAFAKLMMCGL
jgi:hypothetical protein